MGCDQSRGRKPQNPGHVTQFQPDHTGSYLVQMAPQGNQQVRKPPSLKELGYEARRYTPAHEGLAKYIIKQPQCLGYLAILAVASDGEYASTTLFVNFVDMTADVRGDNQRPRLRQMLAAFWTDPVGRNLRQLRRILFQNVTENFTRAIIRERIAPLMDVGYSRLIERPFDDIILNAPKTADFSHHAEAWNLACTHSKLVRSAIGLLREFPMADSDEELAAVQIVISPAFDQAGNAHNFDLEIVLGQRGHQEVANVAS
ncbi:hypothetical protein N0V82_004440 [Gnomoniopsis sp. IMI 355080]|nr:hypothetical protein N0V82_004440 [Gnomoniopsis sp. IMI 355080]